MKIYESPCVRKNKGLFDLTGDAVFRFRISLLNIYFWNILAIAFFCIKFLPEFAEFTLTGRIMISASAVIVFLITTQINFIRHIVCISVSFLWSVLIAQTLNYYFDIDQNTQMTIYIVVTIAFYIWHLLFMENPFNIISKVAVDAPTEFSPDVKYVPNYIPFTDNKNFGSYISQYFNDKNNYVTERCTDFENTLSKSEKPNVSVILKEYHNAKENFDIHINKIIADCNCEYLTNDAAKIQIDEACDKFLLKVNSLISELGE